MYRILIVDDDIEIIKFCKHALRNHDIEVIGEEKPFRVKDLIRAQRLNLAILDINIPGFSGVRLLKEIKSNNPFTFPTVMFTAQRTVKDVEECISQGAKDYLVKPLKIKDLQTRILKHLEKTEDVLPFSLYEPRKARITLSEDLPRIDCAITEVSEYQVTVISNNNIAAEGLVELHTDLFREVSGIKHISSKMPCLFSHRLESGEFRTSLSTRQIANVNLMQGLRDWCKRNKEKGGTAA